MYSYGVNVAEDESEADFEVLFLQFSSSSSIQDVKDSKSMIATSVHKVRFIDFPPEALVDFELQYWFIVIIIPPSVSCVNRNF